MPKGTKVYLECGKKKVFASAIDWPGWARSGKTEQEALERLGDYAERYAAVAKEAGVRFPADAGKSFDVVERVTGNATTDFGAIGIAACSDSEKVTAAQASRLAAFVSAAWTLLDRARAKAPEELRKGPRGGGRDRDKMYEHVLDADAAYASKIGVKVQAPDIDDKDGIKAMREDILAVIGAPSDGTPHKEKGWSSRWAARRIAWHSLDHVWEMEDRSTP